MLQKSQPIVLRGWREAIMAPTTEKVRIVTRLLTTLPGSASPPYGSSATVDLMIRANEIPPLNIATDSPTSDHANHVTSRRLIRSILSCLG